MKSHLFLKPLLFCLAMLLIRFILTQHFSFVFLIWNLFLAWLPYYFIKKYASSGNRYTKIGLFLSSVLFLPNAPYIITDLFHLQKNLLAPIWMDVILILSFALVGLYFFLLTVKRMLHIVDTMFVSPFLKHCFKYSIMFLSAYGVYLGRYLRFNSWDILTNPFDLFFRIYQSFFNPNHAKETLGMTLCFSAFLFLIYHFYENGQTDANTKQTNIHKAPSI